MPVFANRPMAVRSVYCFVGGGDTHKALPGSIADVWEAESPMLMALPSVFDGFIEYHKRVSPKRLITFQRNRYSLFELPVAPARKDINADFPLCGFVCCEGCAEHHSQPAGPPVSQARSTLTIYGKTEVWSPRKKRSD